MEKNTPFRILIADDDADDLEYMKFLFQNNKNFEIVDCVTSGQAILDRVQQGNPLPDILLTDMYMPILTGAEVVQILRERHHIPEMQVFIISSVINTYEQAKFKDNPNIQFLEKPMTLVQVNDLPGLILEKLNVANTNRI